MATTTYGTPYVQSSDLVSGYPATSSSLADRLDAVAYSGNGLNAQTGTTYTLVLTDAGKTVTLSNAAAITLTVPTNASVAFPTNTVVTVVNRGAGTVTISGAGVTFQPSGNITLATDDVAVLQKVATNTWQRIDGLAAKAPSASPTFTGTVDFSGATVTGLSAAGLTLITTASINAAASTLINTCFTSTYDFYTIIGDLTGSTDLNYLLQLRNAGSTVTAANYQLFGTGYDNGAAARNVSTNGATSWTIGRATAAGVPLHFTLTITRPLENRAPAFSGTSVFYDSTVTSTLQRSHGYRYGASQAFDSLAFSTSTGNVTGTISVYGYRKS